jgi:hypothetical protein
LYVSSGQTTFFLRQSIISGNDANSLGDEIYLNESPSYTLTLQANNYNILGEGGANGIYNQSGNATVNVGSGGDLSGPSETVAQILETNNSGKPALADNGGPTETIALIAGSPAIDLIPPGSCYANEDQRSVSRPAAGGCDVGAYEFPWQVFLPLVIR